MNKYRELFKEALEKYSAELSTQIEWCRACGLGNSHSRGFASWRSGSAPTVHYDSEIATRGTLQGGLHEIAHLVLGHCARTEKGHRKNRQRRYEREAAAEQWANQRMRELGVPVPRKTQRLGKDYVAWTKHWGDNVAAGRRRAK
jgi:hypothetical protein